MVKSLVLVEEMIINNIVPKYDNKILLIDCVCKFLKCPKRIRNFEFYERQAKWEYSQCILQQFHSRKGIFCNYYGKMWLRLRKGNQIKTTIATRKVYRTRSLLNNEIII